MQETLAALNAALNFSAGVLLVTGYVAIKRGAAERHKKLMISALVVSVLFLVSYLTRMALAARNGESSNQTLRRSTHRL